MNEYGYINEEGYLHSKMLEILIERYKDESEEIKERVVTIEEQAAMLIEQGWKPVDLIDESRMIAEEGYNIEISPYDAGECISYRYKKTFDRKEVNNKIQNLKKQLSNDDYKITKCYEASLLKEPLPYNVIELHAIRNELRAKINELEELLKTSI